MRHKKHLLPILICGLLLGASVAQAHTEESDGDVQGVMHITPSHEPTAGKLAHFKFFMSNTKGSFDSSAYTYTLTVTGEDMATGTPVVSAEGDTLTADFIFPHEAEDNVATLVGSSTVPDQPSFTLDFDDIKVLPPDEHEDFINNLMEQHGAHVALVVIIILAFAGIVGYDRLVVRAGKNVDKVGKAT